MEPVGTIDASMSGFFFLQHISFDNNLRAHPGPVLTGRGFLGAGTLIQRAQHPGHLRAASFLANEDLPPQQPGGSCIISPCSIALTAL